MGDNHQRQPLVARRQLGDRTVDLLLGAAVERRGRLVEEEYVGPAVERAGDADALALSTRKAAAAFADMGVHAFGKSRDELSEPGGFQRFGYAAAVDFVVGNAQRDVGREASVGDEKVLRDVADAVLPCAAVGGGEGRAVDRYFASGRFVKSQQQVEKRRFPCARCAADADAFALADRERKAAEKLVPVVREAEAEVADGDFMFERQYFGRACSECAAGRNGFR